MHGAQSLDPARRREPLTYFYPNGPLGQLFASLAATRTMRSVAVVGLGAGSIGCYRQPGESWTFYEIDAAVARIAADPRYFTFLQDCVPEARIVLGDGRMSLASAAGGEYDLIVLDAFSSDAVPVHLVTREALDLYLQKLAPGGLLVFNITNRHLDLQTVIGNLARAAGLTSRVQHDLTIDPYDAGRGKMGSQWAVLARRADDLGPIAGDRRWVAPRIRPGTSAWTDDFNSLLSVYVWD
jgi:spermidine synthase